MSIDLQRAPGQGVTTKDIAGTATGSLVNAHLLFATGLLFLLPNAIFAAALQSIPAAVVLAGSAGAAALLWRSPRDGALAAPVDAPELALSLVVAFTLCLLGGEGHIFYATQDWLTRDAVLADLVSNGPTVLYRYGGQEYLLRAPLGMYTLPAAVGQFFGLMAAHVALLIQNSLIVGTILYFVALLARTSRTPTMLVFIGFSGLDIVGAMLGYLRADFSGGNVLSLDNLEWWGSALSWLPLQYSSNITQLFWVPNHMAPGWWFGLLTLLYVRRDVQLPTLLVSFAALVFWSPLAMIGAAPFLVLFALELAPSRLFAWRNIAACVIGLCFAPIALYLVIDAGSVPSGWLITQDTFFARYFLFIVIEIPQAAIVFYAWDKVEPSDRRIFILAVAVLLVLPVYALGPGNDLVMRSSIPSLFLIAFVFARIAVSTPRDNGAFATVISSIIIISGMTGAVEFARALHPRYAISDCNLLSAWRGQNIPALPTNYLARTEKIPDWLMLGDQRQLTFENRACWPDHPSEAKK